MEIYHLIILKLHLLLLQSKNRSLKMSKLTGNRRMEQVLVDIQTYFLWIFCFLLEVYHRGSEPKVMLMGMLIANCPLREKQSISVSLEAATTTTDKKKANQSVEDFFIWLNWMHKSPSVTDPERQRRYQSADGSYRALVLSCVPACRSHLFIHLHSDPLTQTHNWRHSFLRWRRQTLSLSSDTFDTCYAHSPC